MQSNNDRIERKVMTDGELAMLEKALRKAGKNSRMHPSDDISYLLGAFCVYVCIGVVFLFMKVVSSAK
jgi:hypothetical protein